jgi:hypothetical protein
MSSVVGWAIRSTPPPYAEHVERADAPFSLPEGATDVSFCQGVRGMTAFEFTTDEEAFRKWVESGIGSSESQAANVPLSPITAPITITRYNALSKRLKGPRSVTVNSGLHYRWSYEDGGIYAVFDSSTNRAYFYAYYH